MLVLVAIVSVGLYIYVLPSAPSMPVAAPDIISGTPNATYTNTQLGFSIDYPSSATSSAFTFDGYLPLTQTPVASFVLPRSMSAGTNLGEAGVYIGATTTPAIVQNCTVMTTNLGESGIGSEVINGAEFAVATSTGAGAGNLYEEKIYRTVKNDTCIELVEMLHSGNIYNYPAGTVVEFDHAKFSAILDAIVRTIRFR